MAQATNTSPAIRRGFRFKESAKAPILMGIVNVTPDSFSDGGQFAGAQAAIDHGLKLRQEGAEILDVGGESTRPGAQAVGIQEEMDRVIPVIEGLVKEGANVSVDTRNGETMKAAIAVGAAIVNDVTALTHDPKALGIVAASDASVVLMHMKGDPRSMQNAPRYDDVVSDVMDYLASRIKACNEAGIVKERIAIDPGIGFAKNDDHNLALLNNLSRFKKLGCSVLVGLSRKSLIGRIAGVEDPGKREAGTIALNLAAFERGAQIFRVHDVAMARQAFTMWRAVKDW